MKNIDRSEGMVAMKRKLLLAAALILAVLIISPNAISQTSPGQVSVDTIFVEAGQHFPLPLRLTDNELDLAGIMVPMKYSSSSLTVDSVSFIGSFITGDYHGAYYTDELTNTVQVTVLPPISADPIVPMSNPNGLIANMWCTVAPDTDPGVIVVDSINQEDPYWQKVHATDASGTFTFMPDFAEGAVVVMASTDIVETETNLPGSFQLAQNYPNPFNPSTVIEFALPSSGRVKLQIFNVLGQEVEVLVDRSMSAGTHQVEFNARTQPSGVYFYRLTHSEGTITKKMILVK